MTLARTTSPQAATPVMNVLALHGYHGSAAVLRQQIAPLASALPASIKLTYLDAPSLARGDFGWWHEGFTGWRHSLDWVLARAERERFDGVIGFSQGGAMAGLLAAVQEYDDHQRTELAGHESSTTPAFRFAVMIGGFTSDAPQHAALFRHPLRMPSVHVIGTADTIVPARDSLRLAARFADPIVITHHGGHVIPHEPTVVKQITDFLTECADTRPARNPEPTPDGIGHLR